MTPEEIKAAARKEMARRELARRETAKAGDVSRETMPERNVFESMPGTMGRMATGVRAAMEDPGQFARDFAEGVDTAVRGAADVLTLGAADEAAAAARSALGEDYETALAEERARDKAADPMLRTAGALPAAVALGGAVGAPRTLLQATLQAGGFGTAYGFGSGQGGAGERLKEGLKGGAAGAAVAAPVYGVANVVAPQIRRALQTLRQEGVRPTVGQMAGGMVRRLEEGAKSVPIAGSMIRGAEMRALQDFNRGAINHALRPAGLRLGPKDAVGREGVDKAWDLINKSYDEVLDAIPAVRVDEAFRKQFADTMTRAQNRLGQDAMRDFINALDDIRSLPSVQSGKVLTGQEARKIVGELRPMADKLSKSNTPNIAEAGTLLGNVRRSLNNLLKRNASPDQAAQLTGLDRARAGFDPIMKASKADAANRGIFTPNQYIREIRKQSTQSGRTDFQRGRALNQEFGEAAQEVIPSRVPDSGTPERLATMGLGYAGGTGMINPVAAAAAGVGVLPYTRLGQNAIARLAMRQPSRGAQILAESLRRSAVPAAAGAIAARE